MNRSNSLRRVQQQVTRRDAGRPSPVRQGRAAKPQYCFVAGTLVATSAGLRPIEEIAVGDLVWSRSEETGETRLQEVVELFRTPDQVVYDVDLEAADGTVETLGVTAEHPFRVAGVGWVGAADLEAGDEIVTNREGWLKVRSPRLAGACDGLQLRGRGRPHVLRRDDRGLGPNLTTKAERTISNVNHLMACSGAGRAAPRWGQSGRDGSEVK